MSDLDVDDRGVGHGGVALTPTGDDEPLELPDGCQHISLSHFLEASFSSIVLRSKPTIICTRQESLVMG